MRRAPVALVLLLGVLGLAACTDEADPAATDSPLCAEAAAHLDTCLPGLATDTPETCGADDEAHATWILSRSCDQLLLDAGDGKADGVPALQGVKIRREGNLTYFSVPLARTAQADRGYLFDKMIAQFSAKMGQLNTSMRAHGLDMSSALTGPTAEDFLRNYTRVMNEIIGTNTSTDVAVAMGETVAHPTKLGTWQRYVTPQLFLAYFSARFTANFGIGVGGSATVIIAIQPWLTLAVDHTLAQPKVVAKQYEVDVDLLGVPNLDVGIGVGGGVGVRFGLGTAVGPIDQPHDLAGTGLGISGAATVPLLGGVAGKLITILKYPPLFMLLVGYSSGTSAEVELHGNVQQILDLNGFLGWLDTVR